MTTIHEKREKRKKQTAEVFTPKFLVQDMLNKIPDDFWNDPNKTLLEPACGDGNFLEEIYFKKLQYNHPIHLIVKNVYALDIMDDNIKVARKRLIDIIITELKKKNLDRKTYAKQLVELCSIVCHNIKKTEDTLKEDFDSWETWDELNSEVKMNIRKLTLNTLIKKKMV
jgi:ubiquinone/menaquinone biosynthesis C-methylase UbiE